jgi:DNA-binding CsgD family transcriptional regulator
MTDLDMLESLLDCTSVDELHASTKKLVHQLGYEHFIYVVRVNTSLAQPYQFVFSRYPNDWLTHYIDSRYQDIDPAFIHCIKERRVTPIVWNKQTYAKPDAARMLGEAGEHGLRAGVTFSIQGAHGEAGLFSLATPTDEQKARNDIRNTLAQAQLLACYLHEAIHRTVLTKQAVILSQPVLTEREKECLLWAAEGKTTWEIANIIHVAERTVVFHIQNATRKMGVATRQHAVARAVSMGIVAPPYKPGRERPPFIDMQSQRAM